VEMHELKDYAERMLKAQEAIDAVLSREQQARERQSDGTFRVLCQSCGKSVSSPLPVAVVVRALVVCPECVGTVGKRH